MVNVVIGVKRNIKVSANATAGIIDTTTPVTLKNTPSNSSGGASRFDNLNDVVATDEVNGAVPVYDETTGKYIVRVLDLDGGEF